MNYTPGTMQQGYEVELPARAPNETPSPLPWHRANGDISPDALDALLARVAELERLVTGLCAVERGRGPARGMRPPSGDEVWRQATEP